MTRIAVIGCGGSGKTTVARALAQQHGLPLVEADRIVYADGHTPRPEADWHPELNAHADEDEWVIDGMKLSLLEHRVARADTVVFLDLPRRSCYLGVAQRGDRWRDLRNVEFLRWIWAFPRKARPHIHEILERHRDDTEVIVLRSRREVRASLRRWRAAGQSSWARRMRSRNRRSSAAGSSRGCATRSRSRVAR